MPSQGSSQSQKRTNRDSSVFYEMSESERMSLVSEVAMYLLSQENSKIPAKKVSIVKTILQRHSKTFRTIIAETKDMLKQILGYQLIDCDGKYFLINLFEPSDVGLKILKEPEEHKKRCILLTLVLSLIFMEGGTIKEDEMWNFLRRLNIQVADAPDPVFGDIKKILTKDFVHMLYLQHSRREGTDPPIFEFSSGPRADHEVSKRKLLKFVCMVYGNSEDNWPVHQTTLQELEFKEQSEAQDLSQLMNKRMRISEPSASQSSSSSQHTSSRNVSQRRGKSPSPQPGPSSRP